MNIALHRPAVLPSFLAHQRFPYWKSHISHMHQTRFWNQLPDSSASPVLSRSTSSFTCQAICVIVTAFSIHYFFTLSLHAHKLPFQQILPTLIDFWYPLWLVFTDHGTGPDFVFIGLIVVRFSLNFLFVPCSRQSRLPVSFWLHD